MNSSPRRALEVLEVVSTSPGPIGVTAIAQRTGLAAGTAYRSLDALERQGYIARYQSSTQYVPGQTMRRLRQSLFARFRVRDVCLPFMHQLAFATGSTTTLTVPVGWFGITIAVTSGAFTDRSVPALGSIVALGSSCAARAILATFPPKLIERYRAWHTAASLPPFERDELAEIARLGYAAERTPRGSVSVAFPIPGPERVAGALAVIGPADTAIAGVAPELLAPAREAIERIGRLATEHPELFNNPFDHIDPDSIDLPIIAHSS